MNLASSARGVMHRARDYAYARRQLLDLPEAHGMTHGQTVYFLTPDHDSPAGGIRVIYRHVDILNANGIPAAVLHQRPGFRCTWFENDTVVRNVRGTVLGRGDLLVVGERNVGSFLDGPLPYDHIIFNQNSFETSSGHPARVDRYYSGGPRPKAILTVSEYARSVLSLAFPQVPVDRVHLAIDPVFRPGGGNRERTITYMPRKGAGDQAALLLKVFERSQMLDGWRFEPLDGLRHEQVAHRLRTSTIFLSFADREGFGLPAAEAMACGNFVVGSHGYGGAEFFDPGYCSVVGMGDMLGMARALLESLAQEKAHPDWLERQGRLAADAIAQAYSPEVERRHVIQVYSRLLGHP